LDRQLEYASIALTRTLSIRILCTPEAVRKQQRTPKKRYFDIIQDTTGPEAVFDKVIKQLVTIKLQDLLACSPTFANCFSKVYLYKQKRRF
jgi:hypothetical protein